MPVLYSHSPQIGSVKPFKLENQQSNLYKNEKRETLIYKPHKQKTTTGHQIPSPFSETVV